MDFSVVFDNSGDVIQYTALDSNMFKVLEFYVESLEDAKSNSFTLHGKGEIVKAVDTLDKTVKDINSFVYPFLESNIPLKDNKEDYLDQYYLSKLHADWVFSQDKTVNIKEVVSKYVDSYPFLSELESLFSADEEDLCSVLSSLGLSKRYNDINEDIHAIERYFNRRITFRTTCGWVQFKNPFPKTWTRMDNCHFSIDFHHLGRHLHNRFLTYDMQMEHKDENTFNELLGFIDLSLCQPQTIEFSKEYLAWCKERSVEPAGIKYAIGNISDIHERLIDYRKILYRNIKVGNTVSIVLG